MEASHLRSAATGLLLLLMGLQPSLQLSPLASPRYPILLLTVHLVNLRLWPLASTRCPSRLKSTDSLTILPRLPLRPQVLAPCPPLTVLCLCHQSLALRTVQIR